MTIFTYQANELFNWLTSKEDILVLDVRNAKDFKRFQVESPYPFKMTNISYYDFMEEENESVNRLDKQQRICIICAKEGSAKYVAEILLKHGFEDVGYLCGGIKTWGNLLIPQLINPGMEYELYQFIRPGKASCSYCLIFKKEMMIFDPSRAMDFYMTFANDKDCRIIKTFETHLQADYISGSRDISEKTGADFLANDGDFSDSKNRYTSIQDQQILYFAEDGPEIKAIFSPGHTPGSTMYLIDNTFLISGDMIFITSIGRPDLGGKAEKWAKMLFESMQMVKKTLTGSLIVLPGHYMAWSEANKDLLFFKSLKTIMERNQDIYEIKTLAGFIDFIKDNIRPQPEEYSLIRLANANLEHYDPARQEELDLGKNECAASHG